MYFYKSILGSRIKREDQSFDSRGREKNVKVERLRYRENL